MAIFNDEHGNAIKEEELPNYGVSELATWLQERGFKLKTNTEAYGAEPMGSVTFQGHKYDFYSERNVRSVAEEFASSRGGKLLSLETSDEAAFVLATLQDLKHVVPTGAWLAASDAAQEGEWIWEAGSSAGKTFFSGNHENGSITDGHYVAWNQGEPNNANGVSAENCAVALARPHTNSPSWTLVWNDVPCEAHRAGLIIEFASGSDTAHQEL